MVTALLIKAAATSWTFKCESFLSGPNFTNVAFRTQITANKILTEVSDRNHAMATSKNYCQLFLNRWTKLWMVRWTDESILKKKKAQDGVFDKRRRNGHGNLPPQVLWSMSWSPGVQSHSKPMILSLQMCEQPPLFIRHSFRSVAKRQDGNIYASSTFDEALQIKLPEWRYNFKGQRKCVKIWHTFRRIQILTWSWNVLLQNAAKCRLTALFDGFVAPVGTISQLVAHFAQLDALAAATLELVGAVARRRCTMKEFFSGRNTFGRLADSFLRVLNFREMCKKRWPKQLCTKSVEPFSGVKGLWHAKKEKFLTILKKKKKNTNLYIHRIPTMFYHWYVW